MHLLRFSQLLAVAGMLLSTPLMAQEWTRFRGPNGTGVSDTNTIPAQWTEDDYQFKIKLPGSGHSSPVLWGDKLFTLSADPEDGTRLALGIDADAGTILWQRAFPASTHSLHERSSYASSTPTVDRERVYFAWGIPERATLIAFTHDGEIAWKTDLGPWTGVHGFGTSPILYNGLVILHNSQQSQQLEPDQVAGESSMMAFDAETGEEVWRTPLTTTRVCYSVPFLYQPPGGGPDELVCTSTGDGVFSLDPQTGRENWSLDAFRMRTVSSPIEVGGLIIGSTGSGGGGNYIAAVRPGPNPSLAYTLANSNTFKAPYVPCAVSRDELAFFFYDRGYVACIEASTGEVHALHRAGSGFSGSPIRAGEKIYCMNDRGDVLVYSADKEMKQLGSNPLGENSRATPAVAGGRMYLRTQTQLFCVGG